MTKFGYKLGYSFKNINTVIYFENLTIGLHVFYTLNTDVKFCINQMLFIIRFLNLFFKPNFRL